jgi:hypothetical protein
VADEVSVFDKLMYCVCVCVHEVSREVIEYHPFAADIYNTDEETESVRERDNGLSTPLRHRYIHTCVYKYISNICTLHPWNFTHDSGKQVFSGGVALHIYTYIYIYMYIYN